MDHLPTGGGADDQLKALAKKVVDYNRARDIEDDDDLLRLVIEAFKAGRKTVWPIHYVPKDVLQ